MPVKLWKGTRRDGAQGVGGFERDVLRRNTWAMAETVEGGREGRMEGGTSGQSSEEEQNGDKNQDM